MHGCSGVDHHSLKSVIFITSLPDNSHLQQPFVRLPLTLLSVSMSRGHSLLKLKIKIYKTIVTELTATVIFSHWYVGQGQWSVSSKDSKV